MEPSVRLYTPNGPGRPRKRVTRPLKQSEVVDGSMPAPPAAEAPVVKPPRARKKESAAKRKPAKTPANLEPAACLVNRRGLVYVPARRREAAVAQW